MTWFGWVLALFILVNSALSPLLIGAYRKPITPGVAALTVVMGFIEVVLILTVGTGLGL
jgi:hypothetical protein